VSWGSTELPTRFCCPFTGFVASDAVTARRVLVSTYVGNRITTHAGPSLALYSLHRSRAFQRHPYLNRPLCSKPPFTQSTELPSWAHSLSEHGFAHLPDIASEDRFRSHAAQLGLTIHETAIELRPDSRQMVHSHQSLDLHTDHPEARWIGWYCVRQAKERGESILVDLSGLQSDLDPSIVETLSRISVEVPTFGGRDSYSLPLLSRSASGTRVAYLPWLVRATPAQLGALYEFKRYIAECLRDASIRIRLKSGDGLFIDNHRMLHGRRALEEYSERLLIRLWLSSA